MTDILMPALSPTMEEGKLAKWLVKEGDTVKPGDVIAEIETDKATMEVEAVDEGVISKLVIPEGRGRREGERRDRRAEWRGTAGPQPGRRREGRWAADRQTQAKAGQSPAVQRSRGADAG